MGASSVVVAIDVGYRNVKFAYQGASDKTIFKSFPAIAPIASERDLGVDRNARRRGGDWHCGRPDPRDASPRGLCLGGTGLPPANRFRSGGLQVTSRDE